MFKRFAQTFVMAAFFAAAVYSAVFAVHILDFPSEIRLTENTQHRLLFAAPLRATISPDSLETLIINHQPIAEPVTVSLQDPLWFEAGSSGTATMTLSAFGLPLREVALDVLPEIEVIPFGITVGVRINTDGVMVLGTGTVTGTDGRQHNPSGGKLRAGDLILSANGRALANKEDFKNAIAESGETLTLSVRRDNETIETTIRPVQSERGNAIGSWVRDSTQGIGTITYFNPQTMTFGALGHGIMDVDTKKLMSVKSGRLTAARITSIKRGARGTPGELVGEIEAHSILGQIKTNSPVGIYGTLNEPLPPGAPTETMRIAKQDQIEEGQATIRTNVVDNIVRDYEILIEGVNRFSADDTKGMVIRITDPALLDITGGIVQGMSGSPIIQNGRLIGAVTHVFVQDPTKGYGIFIENMLRQEQNSEV